MNHWQGWLYVAAVLIPLGAFIVELLAGRVLRRLNAYIATGAIATSSVLSLIGLASYLSSHPESLRGLHAESPAAAEAEAEVAPGPEAAHGADTSARAWTGSVDWVVLGAGLQADGNDRTALSIPLGIHIDGLAVI